MKVSFKVKITEKEMYTFLFNHTYRKFTSILMFVFGLVCIVGAIYTWGDVNPTSSLLLLLLGSLYTIIQPYLLWKNTKKQMKKNPVYENELEYQVDETGITVSQGETTTHKKWEEFWKAKDYGSIVVIYIMVNNGIILPKKAIGEDYNTFVDIVSANMPSNLKKRG